MRKWNIGLLAAVMALTFAACGPKTTNPKTPEPVVTQATEQENTTQNAEGEEMKQPAATSKPTATPKPTKIPEPEIGIREVFDDYGLKAGTCLSDYMIGNKKCTEIIKKNFNSITFENHLKPDAILDQKASKEAGDLVVKFNWTTLKLLDWCVENEMAMRGHTLIWYSQTPDWIFYDTFDNKGTLVDRETMLARMESFIRQTFELLEESGYLEHFYAYDVVNEAWMEDGTMRDCLWLKTIGEDYLWHAFYFADKYAPEYVDLYYNDYNEQFKTETLYNFVQTLVDENGDYLIDGIGFQAHLYTEDNLDNYFATVDRLASIGLKLNLTELDVSLGTWQNIKSASVENLQAQGQYYYNLIGGLLQRVKDGTVHMDALTFWGFSDGLSWRKERSPLLYTSSFAPKHALYGALQIKEGAGFEE